MKYLIWIIVAIGLIAYTWYPSDDFVKVVEDDGFAQIEMGSLDLIHCPKGEYGYSFTGVKDGKVVKGLICRNGIFFGSYVIRSL